MLYTWLIQEKEEEEEEEEEKEEELTALLTRNVDHIRKKNVKKKKILAIIINQHRFQGDVMWTGDNSRCWGIRSCAALWIYVNV